MTNKDKMHNLTTVGLKETLSELCDGCMIAYEFEDYPIEEVFPAMATKRVSVDGEKYFIKMEVKVKKIED